MDDKPVHREPIRPDEKSDGLSACFSFEIIFAYVQVRTCCSI